jgi:hypothetical protein
LRQRFNWAAAAPERNWPITERGFAEHQASGLLNLILSYLLTYFQTNLINVQPQQSITTSRYCREQNRFPVLHFDLFSAHGLLGTSFA